MYGRATVSAVRGSLGAELRGLGGLLSLVTYELHPD
jgi:hypothetical protein